MKIKNRFTAVLILLIALLNSSCFQYQDIEIIEVSEIAIKEISIKTIRIEIAMQIKNPNRFNITITDADLMLFIKDKKIGIANIKEKIILTKQSNEIHRFTIQTNIKDVSAETIPLLMGFLTQSKIEFGVQGNINAKAKGVTKKIPIDFKLN